MAEIKDVLVRCGLPLSLCRGQGYDGASSMQGMRTGVVTQVLSESAAALPLHCFAHSLNLCLEDAERQIKLLRDALEIVREMGKNSSSFLQSELISFHKTCLKMKIPLQTLKYFVLQGGQLEQEPLRQY